jgi:ABC-2 type transport system permease protein
MTLIAVERIKLRSTRSAWWCAVLAVALTLTFAAMFAAGSAATAPVTVASTQFGSGVGLLIVMVMAALAVTTEYRYGTIRATFVAAPRRSRVLLAKAAVVALVCGVLGELCAVGSVAAAKLAVPSADLGIDTAFEWRAVTGTGLIFAIAGVFAVSIGALVRHSAGAIALVIGYTQGVEQLVQFIPRAGSAIHHWLPFNVGNKFLTGNPDPIPHDTQGGLPPSDAALGPWPGAALITTAKRDA